MRTRDEVLAEFQVSYHEHVGPQYSVEARAALTAASKRREEGNV